MHTKPSDAYRVPFMLVIAYVVAYVFTYVFNLFLARVVGPSMYGDVALGMRIVRFLAPLIALGTTASSRRFISSFIATNAESDIAKYIFWNTRLFLFTSAITVFVVTLSLVLLIVLHLYHLQNIKEYHAAIYLLYVAPVISVVQLVYSILLSYRYYMFGAFFTNVMPYILMNILLFFVWLWVSVIHSYIIAGVVLLAYLCVLGIMLQYIHLKIPGLNLKQLIARSERAQKHQKRQWLSTAKNFMANTLVFSFISMIDLLTIELVLHDENRVGYYAAALTITRIILLIRVGFNAFLSVQISHETQNGNKVRLQDTLTKSGSLQLLVLCILCFSLLFYSSQLLGHFGNAYLVARVPVWILIIGTGISVFLTPGTMTLLYGGHERFVVKNNMITLIAFLIFCPIFTYYFGLIGTAMASAILETVPRLINALVARYFLKVRTCLVF